MPTHPVPKFLRDLRLTRQAGPEILPFWATRLPFYQQQHLPVTTDQVQELLLPLGHLVPGVRVQQGLALSAATDLKRASVLNRNRLRTIGHFITYCQNINSEVKKSILFNLVSHHSQESPIEAQKEKKKLNHTHHPWIQLFYCLQATWASTDLVRIRVSVQVGHYSAL